MGPILKPVAILLVGSAILGGLALALAVPLGFIL